VGLRKAWFSIRYCYVRAREACTVIDWLAQHSAIFVAAGWDMRRTSCGAGSHYSKEHTRTVIITLACLRPTEDRLCIRSESSRALEIAVVMNLGIDAMRCIHYIVGSYRSFIIDITSEDADGFCVLAQLGLFVRTGTRYQMSIPQYLSPKDAAAAMKRLLSTMDDDFALHHENIIECMSRSKAEDWQRRLASLSGLPCGSATPSRLGAR
jgi:hypothetical protein